MKRLLIFTAGLFMLNACVPYRHMPVINSEAYPVHSHNDYAHKHPLYDALNNGVNSVEADVYHFLGPLWVCHTPFGIVKLRRIQNWYFRPLKRIIDKNGGYIYKAGETFYVLIEVKTNTRHAMPRLKKIFARYKDMLTTYTNHSVQVKPVTVTILSGRDDAYWMQDSVRYFGVELPFSHASENLNPYVYTQFRLHTGSPEPYKDLNSDLNKQIKLVLARGQRIRANAGQDIEPNWEVMYKSGVTFIHTDKLVELKEFMKKVKSEE